VDLPAGGDRDRSADHLPDRIQGIDHPARRHLFDRIETMAPEDVVLISFDYGLGRPENDPIPMRCSATASRRA
jgi:hypothetical protein